MDDERLLRTRQVTATVTLVVAVLGMLVALGLAVDRFGHGDVVMGLVALIVMCAVGGMGYRARLRLAAARQAHRETGDRRPPRRDDA